MAKILIGISCSATLGQSPQAIDVRSGLPIGTREVSDIAQPKASLAPQACLPQPWNAQAYFVSSDITKRDRFGHDVALSGDYALIGAPDDDELALQAGVVYLHKFNGVDWIQQEKLLPPDGQAGDHFGTAIAINAAADIIAIGAPTQNAGGDNAGAVYIYRRVGGVWNFEAKLMSADIEAFDAFGSALDISGERIIVGAANSDDFGSQSGSAYLFMYDNVLRQWVQETKLLASDGDAEHLFGFSVALNGELALIGAPRWINTVTARPDGAAYVFHLDSGTGIWSEETLLKSTQTDRNFFAMDVALDSLSNVAVISQDEHHMQVMSRTAPASWQTDFAETTKTTGLDNWNSTKVLRVVIESDRLAISKTTGGPNNILPVKIRIFESQGGLWTISSDALTAITKSGASLALSGDRLLVGSSNTFPTTNPTIVFGIEPIPDCNSNGIADYCDLFSGVSTDCNINDIPDECEPLTGDLVDCNVNGIPDICEINEGGFNSPLDCNRNDIIDSCEIAGGTVFDCDFNGIPDDCEIDCNNNGLGDACDLAGGTSLDCDLNGIPDECEFDCNANGIPDGCDLASNPSLDANLNGLIDACECPVQVKLHPSFVSPNARFGNSVDIDGDLAIVGASRENNVNGSNAGAAYIFRRQGLNWVEEARLLDPTGSGGFVFGSEVAISGDLAVVSAPRFSSTGCPNEDSVFVFRYQPASRQWNLETIIGETDPSQAQTCGFGSYLDIENNVIAVLAIVVDDVNQEILSGEAQFFRNDPGLGWHQTGNAQTTLKPGQFIWFPPGSYVLNNDRFIAGSAGKGSGANGSNPGSAFIHRFDGAQWIQEAQLFSNTGDPNDMFGFGVDLDGDTAIVGAHQFHGAGENTGTAWIYRFDGVAWSPEQQFFPPPGFEANQFGMGVVIEGDTAIIASFQRNTNTRGMTFFIYRFEPLAGQWNLQRQVAAFDSGTQDGFGFRFDANDGQIIVGSRFDSELAIQSGAVYIISGIFGPDCDANLEPDVCDIFFGRAEDLNNNAIPDSCEILGDTNDDGIVNVADLLTLLTSWGSCPAPCPADFDANGNVSVADLLILLINWG